MITADDGVPRVRRFPWPPGTVELTARHNFGTAHTSVVVYAVDRPDTPLVVGVDPTQQSTKQVAHFTRDESERDRDWVVVITDAS